LNIAKRKLDRDVQNTVRKCCVGGRHSNGGNYVKRGDRWLPNVFASEGNGVGTNLGGLNRTGWKKGSVGNKGVGRKGGRSLISDNSKRRGGGGTETKQQN